MSYLDKRVLLKANLKTRSIKEEKQSEIFFYNTDENIANLYMKLIYVTDDGLSKELQKDEVSGYSLKMTAIKPKTNQIREVDGVLSEDLSNNEGTCAIFKFQLGTEFTNQIGDVICCTKIIKDAQKLNMDYFVYTIKADKLTGLNAEITSNPDLPVLKQLIKEVKETAQTVNNIDDVNITDTKTFSNKKIEEKFTDVDSQIKDIAKDVLLEENKLYLKKSDGTKLGTGVILPISGSGGSVTWESITSKPTAFTPSSHSHSKSDITDFPTIPTVSNDLTNALKANYDSAYTHSTSAHAPSTAQKNSDITKEEIEAKLTGEISTHSHANCVPTGGTSGQVLAKVDETDYNTNWINPPSSEWVKLGKITLTPEIVSAEWDIPNAKELFLMLKNTNTSTFEAGWLKHHINNGGERGISPAVKIDAGKYMIMSIQNINRNVVTRFNSNISDVFGGGVDQLRTIFTMIDTDYITHYKILPDNVPVLMDVEVYYR